ncbi:MAG: SDR family oxidoreductase [Lachnospiraceae bacterium]|jgi:3-oxoacyl-[acyl-carrier protein] reductase|nr:SDR family oxidoreductase [Lachnospiraceae bacterium]
MSTKNKTIFITGANSEIATFYIKEKSQDYDCIIAHYRHRHDRIDGLKGVLEDKLVPVSADLSSRSDVEKLVEKLKSYEIDEFLHVAAPKLRHMRFVKGDLYEFELEMQVVYWSFFQICQTILPGMVKRGKGRIVSILTEYTVTNQPPYLSHYISAKFALLGLMKSLAGEYAVKGIRVNGISPGLIETDFISQLPQYVIENNAKTTIKGKNLNPSDLISTISYLLSEESGSINGQNILLQ